MTEKINPLKKEKTFKKRGTFKKRNKPLSSHME